jgi:hypothetical protein
MRLTKLCGYGELPGLQGIRGVGPAERTGKSSVRYWPGGSCGLLSRLRPLKPLVTVPIDALLQRSAYVQLICAAPIGARPRDGK